MCRSWKTAWIVCHNAINMTIWVDNIPRYFINIYWWIIAEWVASLSLCHQYDLIKYCQLVIRSCRSVGVDTHSYHFSLYMIVSPIIRDRPFDFEGRGWDFVLRLDICSATPTKPLNIFLCLKLWSLYLLKKKTLQQCNFWGRQYLFFPTCWRIVCLVFLNFRDNLLFSIESDLAMYCSVFVT